MTATAPTTKPTWVRIERKTMDDVVKVGQDTYIKNEIPKYTDDRLALATKWANDLDAQKAPGQFLIFPVSKPKQVNAGKLYLGSLRRFMQALVLEQDRRTTASVFSA